MKTAQTYLLEWLERFIKSKDVFAKKIVSMSILGDHLLVKEKLRDVDYMAQPFRVDFSFAVTQLKKEHHQGIIVYNTTENLKNVLANWKAVAQYDKLVIYFVNPLSKTEKRWVIFPHTHNSVSDPASLQLGLKTMFETVEPLVESDLNNVLK